MSGLVKRVMMSHKGTSPTGSGTPGSSLTKGLTHNASPPRRPTLKATKAIKSTKDDGLVDPDNMSSSDDELPGGGEP